MRVWITGSKNILGKAVIAASQVAGYEIHSTTPWECPISDAGCVNRQLREISPDVIINCEECVPTEHVSLDMIAVNTLGPHMLARFGVRVLHMSTDKVYSGQVPGSGHNDMLTHMDNPDPKGLYGRSKLAGEVDTPNVLNVRGSYIGFEDGFLRWLLHASGDVDGWINAYWNGGYVEEMAKVLVDLARGTMTGVVNVASPTVTTKHQMAEYLRKELDLPITVTPVRDPFKWRALQPDIELAPVDTMLVDLSRKAKRLVLA